MNINFLDNLFSIYKEKKIDVILKLASSSAETIAAG